MRITNLAEFRRGWQRALKAFEDTALDVYRGLASTVFSYVVEETPEYTGESVANWTFHVGGALLKTTSGIKTSRAVRRKGGQADPVWQMPGTHLMPTIHTGNGGNPEALTIARDALRAGFQSVKSLADTIFIANATKFDRGDYKVGALENPPGGWLRAVNQPGHMVERAVSYAAGRFRRIDASNIRTLMVMPA